MSKNLTEQEIINIVKNELPELSKMGEGKANNVILTQDAFAEDYQEDEFRLFGIALKYLGLCKKTITIIPSSK